MHIAKFHNFFIELIITLIVYSSIISTSFGNSYTFNNKLHTIDTLDERANMMFRVSYGKLNSLDVKNHPAYKKQAEKFLFKTTTELPEGFLFSNEGMLTWSPTSIQFNKLKEQTLLVEFYAHAPSDNYIIGQIRVIGQGDVVTENEVAPSDSSNVTTVIIAEPSQIDEESEFIPISIQIPSTKNWDAKKEGESFSFKFEATGGSGDYKFELLEPDYLMGNLDQYGNFNWTPDFDITSRNEIIKTLLITIKAFDTEGKDDIKTVPIYIEHVNRPPVVSELPTFYIQFNRQNTYQLNKAGLAYDPDGDSIIFKPVLKELPQRMTLNKKGDINWKPSRKQFNFLSSNPLYLSFTVEDYPEGAKTIGQIRIEVSQDDLPPQITMIPNKEKYELSENEELQLNFFITDPNGDDDLLSFGFVSENGEINDEALAKKKNGQYEFNWIPGYDFIEEEGANEEFSINFFAIDKESNRSEKVIQVTVEDTENLLEKDRILYDQYRTVLERSWDMIIQLQEKENQFNKEYKVAKKGKKNRSIITAGLGGLTGLATIIEGDAQKWVTGLGGTATATLGTLEAGNVIGVPPSDIMQKLSYVSQKRNDLVVYGNVFASKYALPLSRRAGSFQSDLRSLSINLNLKDIAKLELDSTWENSKKPSDKNIKKEFKDFNPDPRFSKDYK